MDKTPNLTILEVKLMYFIYVDETFFKNNFWNDDLG